MSDTQYAILHLDLTAIANAHGLASTSGEASTWASSQYPGDQHNTIADAARHAYWSCLLVRYTNHTYAAGLATAHEVGSASETETIMDLHNNAVGRSLANQHVHGTDNTCCRNAVIQAVNSGTLWYLDRPLDSLNALLQPTNRNDLQH